jgi:PKD repeat protein
MKILTILGIFALFLLLVIPGVVSAVDVTVSGSIAQPAPVADFTVTATNGLAPITVSFTDTSTVTIGSIDTWKWEYRLADNGAWTEFGSGAQNPTDIVFSTPGTYDIRLTVSNSGGSDTKTVTHAFSAAMASNPLVTVGSGTVSGDLYMNSVSPFTATATQTFTLPASAVGNVQWARLYVNTYSGSYTSDRRGTSVVTLDSTTLGTETLDVWQGFPTGSSDPTYSVNGKFAYPVNDHVMKVMSDYEAVYDVTSLITTATPSVTVTNTPLDGYTFDGRIKGITLLVAYNDGDTDQVKYIVNHGNDWMGPAGQTSSTTFDASSFSSGWADATVTSVAHSSTDGTYTFNAGSPTKTTLLSGTYIKWDSFDVNSLLTSGSNTFGYTAAGSSFKICTAALTAKYTTPTAAFSGTPLTGDAPLTVTFTDESTGAPTAWAWDFNNDGTTDSTAQNPSYTYDTPGIYTVKLTVSNALGSDDEVKAGYITVKTPAPVADFTYTPASGAAPLTVAFTSTSNGVINSYAWDFNNDGTTDSTDANPSYTYNAAGTYSVKLAVSGPDYSDVKLKENIISVGFPTITVNVAPDTVSFGQMAVGDNTGLTSVAVTTDGGTAWSVTAATNNGGYMKDGTKTLAQAFQLANGGGAFQEMTSPFTGFMSGTADEDKTNTANVKQVRESGDQPGSYSIQLTFTGSFV